MTVVCDIFTPCLGYDDLFMCVTLAVLFAYNRPSNISSGFLPCSLLVKHSSQSRSETHVFIFKNSLFSNYHIYNLAICIFEECLGLQNMIA